MRNIKFSHLYTKIRNISKEETVKKIKLLHVFEIDFSEIGYDFNDYDTDRGVYPLPKRGPCLVLLFRGQGGIMTTIRRQTPEKTRYYQANIGKSFDIVIQEQKKILITNKNFTF